MRYDLAIGRRGDITLCFGSALHAFAYSSRALQRLRADEVRAKTFWRDLSLRVTGRYRSPTYLPEGKNPSEEPTIRRVGGDYAGDFGDTHSVTCRRISAYSPARPSEAQRSKAHLLFLRTTNLQPGRWINIHTRVNIPKNICGRAHATKQQEQLLHAIRAMRRLGSPRTRLSSNRSNERTTPLSHQPPPTTNANASLLFLD